LQYKTAVTSMTKLEPLGIVQNHMLQVLANLTMDPPAGEDHEADAAADPFRPGHVAKPCAEELDA
jgi:hypothetical protein